MSAFKRVIQIGIAKDPDNEVHMMNNLDSIARAMEAFIQTYQNTHLGGCAVDSDLFVKFKETAAIARKGSSDIAVEVGLEIPVRTDRSS